MYRILEKILEQSDATVNIDLLVDLVKEIRPNKAQHHHKAEQQIEELILLLKRKPEYRKALYALLENILLQAGFIRLYTQTGILSNEGFFTEAFSKIGHFLLPPEFDLGEIRDILGKLFYKKNDYIWVKGISDETMLRLINAIKGDDREISENIGKHFRRGLIVSVKILSYQITGAGLNPLIVNRFQLAKAHGAPFFDLNDEVVEILELLEDNEYQITNEKFESLESRLNGCMGIIHEIKHEQKTKGADLSLTYLLQSLNQRVERLHVLMRLLFHLRKENHFEKLAIAFYKDLIEAECKKHSLADYITDNIGFVAYQVTEHAGKTGEHYITHNRKEYWRMLRSAMAGGMIVGVLSCLKVLIYYMKLAPFWQAFGYSMNYSLGFVGIHLTHSTLATKQPAMTATKIASSLDVKGTVRDALQSLSELIVKAFRSQFIAFMGNIFLAFPVAFLISWVSYFVFDLHIAGTEQAEKLISELHPWKSLSLFHAGIAGVCLFMAGIISGYYDNAVVFRKIPLRMRQHPFLQRIMSKSLLNKFSIYIDNNLGSLTGNFSLGIFLGSMGTLGFILGLPIDIRHITFASGNFGLAMATLGSSVDWQTILITIIGILGIGFMNFIVSFGLAIFLAIESRGVAFTKTGMLINYVLKSFWRRPLEFFFPPEVVENENENLSEK